MPGNLTMEFKEIIQKDAKNALAQELEHLKTTLLNNSQIDEDLVKQTNEEFSGFQKLFGKFLSSNAQLGIDWDRIEKLPEDSVTQNTFLLLCKMLC